ncbi:MAG: tRNA (guanosine(37)-N1)-methyltransferase TrmD [Pirellulaceae bacterium]|jgi:tRNA (guanine37-N1)-methyltransferase|nr:tRNA (guanosine(37)-N1)-methyltransferase TrmD [Pirellulaceae bacterium]MDP7014479.1 tRNA (guanosine(37)-N1)-methyltransferase TrmD [Pirellulaceae bacterium]
MRFDVLTLFPEMFPGYLSQSLLNKAIQQGFVDVRIHDFRDWTKDKHQSVDDRPFGGGPGMVLKVEPVVECVEAVREMAEPAGRTLLLTPQGRRLDQPLVEQLASERRLVMMCGRYEGFDQRVIDILQPDEISIGDFILNGGEVAAMVLIDAVIRLLPGVLGDEQSSVDDSFSSGNRILEYAQYTRPREYRGREVPEVLLSGDHQAIARWRRQESLEKTRRRRADLLTGGADDQSQSQDE